MPSLDVIGQQAATSRPPTYPFERQAGCPFDPPLDVRAPGQAPRKVTIWDGQTAWLFTHHRQIETLLSDSRVSHDTTNPHYPHETAGFKARAFQGQSFINRDDPEHGRLRRMANPAFTAKRVMALREVIQADVDRLIDEMLAGPKPVDLVAAFALPVPSLMIAILLGIPEQDVERFQSAAAVAITKDTPPAVVEQTQGALLDYLEQLIQSKVSSPSEDLLSDLATKNVATGQITAREAAVTARLLLIGGHETTANMISLSTVVLLQHPEQLAELRAAEDPALMASAVEELLRYNTIAHNGMRRVALEDIELDGLTIKAGDGLILSLDGGNRSPEIYPEPDTLDIHRDARGHLAFGWGTHGCIGQSLARLELQIALGTLYRRIPTLRLAADVEQLNFKNDALIYGLHSLPVTW
jgi:cytochrome P450